MKLKQIGNHLIQKIQTCFPSNEHFQNKQLRKRKDGFQNDSPLPAKRLQIINRIPSGIGFNTSTAAQPAKLLHNKQRSATSTSLMPIRRKIRIKPRFVWDECGWRKDGNTFFGDYKVGPRTWPGKIITPARRDCGSLFDIYCHRPPVGIKRHPHSACWRHVGGGWYWIHYNTPPQDMLSGIKDIENTIAEALKI